MVIKNMNSRTLFFDGMLIFCAVDSIWEYYDYSKDPKFPDCMHDFEFWGMVEVLAFISS